MYPYLKSAAILRCPDDNTSAIVSYGINSNFIYPTDYIWDGNHAPVSINNSQLTAVATTVLLAEVANNYYASIGWYSGPLLGQGVDYGSPGGDGVYVVGICTPNEWTCQYATGVPQNGYLPVDSQYFLNPAVGRHTQGANYTLADGHSKWFLPSMVSAGYLNETSWGMPCGNSDGNGGANAALQDDLSQCHAAISWDVY